MRIRRLSDREISATVVQPEPMSVVQSVFVYALFLGMFGYLLFWLLLWTGLPVERLVLASMGVVGTSTALYLIGTAIRPNRLRGQCNPTSRGDSLAGGPLTLLGVGLWFLVGGMVFLNRALFLGEGNLPKYAVWLVVGTMAAAFVLVIAGSWYDRRRFEVARVAVPRRGWSMASRREDEDLSDVEAQQRQLAREEFGPKHPSTPDGSDYSGANTNAAPVPGGHGEHRRLR